MTWEFSHKKLLGILKALLAAQSSKRISSLRLVTWRLLSPGLL